MQRGLCQRQNLHGESISEKVDVKCKARTYVGMNRHRGGKKPHVLLHAEGMPRVRHHTGNRWCEVQVPKREKGVRM
jgi:hypothetical protein